MKRLMVVLLLSACGTTSSTDAGGAVDAGASFDAGTSIDAGQVTTTVLRVIYPAGTHALWVRGSQPPLNWNTGLAMHQVDAGVYELSLPTLASSLEWKPLLDDTTWSKGANFTAKVGSTTEAIPRFTTDVGHWSRYWPNFSSTILGNTRGVYVYLPAAYDENTLARFPVLYMHDGQNLFDPAASFGGVTWQVPQTMNAAEQSGAFREAIVVGIENTSDRINEYTPTRDDSEGQGGRGDLYLRMLVEELKPRVDAEFRTKTAREDTLLLGSSLGGLISAYAGVTHASTFGVIGAMSPSTWWDNEFILSSVSASGSSRPIRVSVDSGDSGPSNDDVTNTAQLAATYRALGYTDGATLRYVVQPGGTHTESAWASRLPQTLEFLLGPR